MRDRPIADELTRMLPITVAVVFGSQEMRVLFLSLVGFLRDARNVGAITLGVIALAVFSLVFLAPLLGRALGTRRALWATGGGLAFVRVAEQVAQSADVDLVLSAAAVVLFLMFFVIAIGRARAAAEREPRHALPLAFLLGVTLDTAILVALGTLDLSWQPGVLPIGLVVILAAGLVVGLRTLADGTEAADASWSGTAGLVAIGPWFALQMIVSQNPAAVASTTGWSTAWSGLLILAASMVGIVVAVLVILGRGSRTVALLFGAILVGSALPRDMTPLTPGWIALGIVAGFALAGWALGSTVAAPGTRGLRRTTVAFGAGQLLFVLVVFVFYASYDISLGIRSPVIPLAAAVLVAVFAALQRPASALAFTSTVRRAALPVALAACLLAVPLIGLVPTDRGPGALPPPTELTLANYNLHNAVDTDGRLDPEAIARAVEASGADVVGLQEVARGWLIWGDLDMLRWLADRLDMSYAWAPTADAQWGNAILSRYPLRAVTTAPLPPDTLLLRRGYVSAEIETAGGPLRIIATHFTHIETHDPERIQQATVLRDAWGGSVRTLVMGDLNTRPGTAALDVLLDAGLVDVAAGSADAGLTFPSYGPIERIDYILASPDLDARPVRLEPTTASDHLPIAVELVMR